MTSGGGGGCPGGLCDMGVVGVAGGRAARDERVPPLVIGAVAIGASVGRYIRWKETIHDQQ